MPTSAISSAGTARLESRGDAQYAAAFAEYRKRRPLPLEPNFPLVAWWRQKQWSYAPMQPQGQAYTEQHDPDVVAAVDLGGIRTLWPFRC